MWAYRLEPTHHHGLLLTLEKARKGYAERDDIPQNEIDTDLVNVKSMARALGWDGTMVDPIRCFVVPGPDSFMLGYVLTQGTGNQRYVVSPVPLTYLDDVVDWNARTSFEEVQRATAALRDDKVGPPPINQSDWSRSRKGNMYCHINGALVTVFPTKDMTGFKAIVSAPNSYPERKVFTQAFQTELECADDVSRKFYHVVKEWGAPAADYEDSSPFSGVDWGDDDIPF